MAQKRDGYFDAATSWQVLYDLFIIMALETFKKGICHHSDKPAYSHPHI